MAVSAIRKIKHEVHSQDANKALGKVKCFTDTEAVRQVLYFTFIIHIEPQ